MDNFMEAKLASQSPKKTIPGFEEKMDIIGNYNKTLIYVNEKIRCSNKAFKK